MQTPINEWAVPFVSSLDPGQNMFTVDVPLYFCYNTQTAVPNKLYFSKLDLVPDFFSIQAEELDIDTVDEENMFLNNTISLEVVYGPDYLNVLTKRPMYKHGVASTADYVSSILEFLSPTTPYFAKQSFQRFPGFFWDWYDEGVDEPNTPEKFIKEKIIFPTIENWFYGTVAQMDTHFREEFKSITYAKSFPNGIINPYKFPKTKADSGDNTVDSLRIRFHLQPKTSISFSNVALLSILGFDVEHDSKIKFEKRQYVISNNSATTWLDITATRAPNLFNWKNEEETEYPAVDTKVQIKTSDIYTTERSTKQTEMYTVDVPFTKTEFANATLVRNALFDLVYKLANQANVAIHFQNTTGKITLPVTDAKLLTTANIVFSSKAFALKCNYNTEIVTHESTQIEIPTQTADVKKENEKLTFDLKAKSLVFDTNIVYVIALNTIASDRMHPLAPGFVASLHAKDGIMTMAVPWLQQPDFFRITEYQTGTNQVQLQFELYTILPNRQHVKLNWKPGATVVGIIRASL